VDNNLTVISRNSLLAQAQSEQFINHYKNSYLKDSYDGKNISLIFTESLGDRFRDKWDEFINSHKDPALATKRKWIFELEEAIVSGNADIAIHSGKDLPYEVHPATSLLPILLRENPHDILIKAEKKLPDAPRLGTGSLRRKTQLLKIFPNSTIIPIKGNITTRIEKLFSENRLDGIILAQAGLTRAGIKVDNYQIFSSIQMVPAVNQGILVAQFRNDNSSVRNILNSFVDKSVYAVWLAERTCVKVLKASCNTALGVYCKLLNENTLLIQARVVSLDGKNQIEVFLEGDIEQAENIGINIAQKLLNAGGGNFL
jgi:hydroxymethylbilane synthase